MPYSIVTKDGITINGLPDDIDPNSDEVKARVAKIRADRDKSEKLESVETPGMAKGIGQQFAQGLLFNFADEAADKLGYDKDVFRKEEKLFSEENPKTAIASQIAGGVLPALVPFTRGTMGSNPVLASGRMGSALRYAAPPLIGGVQGALSGAGTGDSFDSRVQNALVQGGIGMLATPAMMGAAKILSGPFRSVAGFFNQNVANREGVELLAKAMKDEGLDPNTIAQKVADRTRETGKPVMWLDFVDPNRYPKTYDLMGKGILRGQTTDAKMRLLGRMDETTPRLIDDIKTRISNRAELSFDDLSANRAARSSDFKTEFDKIKGLTVESPEVMEILNRPFAKQATALAVKNAMDEGDAEAQTLFKKYLTLDPKTQEFVWNAAPTVELIQKIKNLGYTPALKSVYQGAPVTTDTGTILRQQRALMDAVDASVPGYKSIRKNFADSADIDSARELGANLQKSLNQGTKDQGGKIKGLRSEEIINEYRAMSRPEQDAFLQGLSETMAANVRNKAGSEGSMKSLSILGDPDAPESAKVKQLQDILGPNGQFSNFIDRLSAEKMIEKTGKEFERRRGATFDGDSSLARDAVRIGGAGLLGRTATAIPAIGSRVGHFLAGQTPKVMQPLGTIATQFGGSNNPLLRMLSQETDRLAGAYSMSDLMSPMFIGGAGQALGPVFQNNNFRKGGLACACEGDK